MKTSRSPRTCGDLKTLQLSLNILIISTDIAEVKLLLENMYVYCGQYTSFEFL